ncbi:MAG TPA: hypothetical protein VH142_16100 [Polyangiaceae bacterium]|jgi:hypothetical protein|nr:hypothetical protein [Polyangiaceae bacterium]
MTKARGSRRFTNLFALSLLPALASCGSSSPKTNASSGSTTDAGMKQPTGPTYPACKNATPRLDQNMQASGYVICDDIGLHRAEKTSCVSTLPRPFPCGASVPDSGNFDSCHSDGDCTTKPNGYCGTTAASASCFCQYGCVTDADCDSGYICLCGSPAGTCVQAKCTSDADCGGGLCIQTASGPCTNVFACQKAGDQCVTDKDCAAFASERCILQGDQHICMVLPSCETIGP